MWQQTNIQTPRNVDDEPARGPKGLGPARRRRFGEFLKNVKPFSTYWCCQSFQKIQVGKIRTEIIFPLFWPKSMTYWCCRSFSKYPNRQNLYENNFPPFLTKIHDVLMLSEFFRIPKWTKLLSKREIVNIRAHLF